VGIPVPADGYGSGRVGSGKCFTGPGIPAFTREKVPKLRNY